MLILVILKYNKNPLFVKCQLDCISLSRLWLTKDFKNKGIKARAGSRATYIPLGANISLYNTLKVMFII